MAAAAKKVRTRLAIESEEHAAIIAEARERFLPYCKLMFPDIDHYDDLSKSRYETKRHHEILAAALEEVYKGTMPRLIVTEPPRHGKTEQISKLFPTWAIGKDPYRSVMFATYNNDFAGDIGRDVRAYFKSDRYERIFPEVKLVKGAASSKLIKFFGGGQYMAIGRGSAATGRGGSILIVDDIIKDAAEADSPIVREKCWNWFTKTFMTRQMTAGAAVIIVMTRWHEDDIVGRLIDPKNPFYDKVEASKWKVLNLPFFAETNDPMGRKPGEVLWPERFPAEFGIAQKRLDPRGFQALYQQRPSPEEGSYFRKPWIKYYQASERPPLEDMRIYAASDHAIGSDKKKHDASVMLIGAVCPNKYLWLLDCYWDRKPPDHTVEQMLKLAKLWNPRFWWAENDAIIASIGPWLQKRKIELGVGGVIDPITTRKNKEVIAQSAAGLMQAGRIMFPAKSPWTQNAVAELLSFPQGANDDFVTALSLMGLKVLQMIGGEAQTIKAGPARGSWEWFKKEMAYQREQSAGLVSEVW